MNLNVRGQILNVLTKFKRLNSFRTSGNW